MNYSTSAVTVAGVDIHLRKSGKGNPILFLHGAGGVLEWLPFFDRLAEDNEVWVPDHPGFGKSDDPKWIKHMPDLAMFYLDFMEELAPAEGFDVVGHSLGGWLAAEIAIRNPAKMRSLTLVSAAGLRLVGTPIGDPFIWNAEERARNHFHSPELQDKMLNMQPSGDMLDEMIKNRYSFAKLAWQPRLFNPDLEKWLHRIKLPTQIIWGREDKIIPVAYADMWSEKVNAASVTIIPDCGHLPAAEKGDALATQIKNFLKQVTA
ncbi:alpha/beta fold hydrolase [Noviherbaspirillum pedocola]|uniref:Alpha/beta fold hydrolase n=1 Tax=Noviherbaspirillum pedocola TaxID=2801341 RepID=A0A934SXL3_9BURK|nr:alpha/beta fold hydrolase [Noviherbaspirillum pedocola]MBK4737388.1 alpha/beta fold hydrolase [Noviherbaspirillum pedocola]